MNFFTKAYRWSLDRFWRRTFFMWERLGLHVTANNFLHPVPDLGRLDPTLFTRQSELPGLDMREDAQLALLDTLRDRYREEYEAFPLQDDGSAPHYYVNNISFSAVDGEIYHAMLRHHRPRIVLEIGSGYTTLLAARALAANEAEGAPPAELTAIEPYPKPFLKAGFPGLSRLIEQDLQAVPLSEFTRLAANDVLFIDSSHMLKIGSDVQYEFLEILPRLQPGVIVHVHDIFFPAEYPRDWLYRNLLFYNEQYLLQAFLSGNTGWEVLWGGSYMHLRHPDKLEAAFPTYTRTTRWPGSFWMRKLS